MRIAVLNWTRRRVAGAEAYLASVIPALRGAGHAVVLVSEVDQPVVHEAITLDGSGWCVSAMGRDRVFEELRRWQPDVLYGNGLLSSSLEATFLELAPAAFIAHGFYGTCISGAKSFKAPLARGCNRRFGWPCLLHYYPHRCGGLNPVTMVRDYRQQRTRLRLLRRYAAVVTYSRRMESEYLQHGIPREQLHRVQWCVEDRGERGLATVRSPDLHSDDRSHLVFLGRMESPKGGHLLIRALPAVRAALGRDLRVTFGGDGSQRSTWEREARRLRARHTGIDITFTGWLPLDERDALLIESDLLVVPSVWPEPFGQVGIEAGRWGVPAAGFAVGGIPDWLESGVNGFLAPGDPPTPQGLAEAIFNCLRDADTLASLRRGAMKLAARWSVAAHLARLEPILASIAQRRTAAVNEFPR